MSIANGDRYASVVLEYERVVKDITDKIADGRLNRGDKLAGEKDLAEEYSVSYTTIRRAMEVLRERGLVESVWGRGTFIIERQK
jgi:GntR family transcriptional regulator